MIQCMDARTHLHAHIHAHTHAHIHAKYVHTYTDINHTHAQCTHSWNSAYKRYTLSRYVHKTHAYKTNPHLDATIKWTYVQNVHVYSYALLDYILTKLGIHIHLNVISMQKFAFTHARINKYTYISIGKIVIELTPKNIYIYE